MSQMILGVFSGKEAAEDAITSLEEQGYDPKEMSFMMQDKAEAQTLADDTGSNMAEGAVSGATTGGVVGALAGLLIGVGAIAIPGIGGLLIAGPLAAALGLTGAAATTVSGAATGALAGGLIGALTGLGVPEEDAKVYEERIKSGGVLLAVPAKDGDGSDVRSILEEEGAEQVRSVTMK